MRSPCCRRRAMDLWCGLLMTVLRIASKAINRPWCWMIRLTLCRVGCWSSQIPITRLSERLRSSRWTGKGAQRQAFKRRTYSREPMNRSVVVKAPWCWMMTGSTPPLNRRSRSWRPVTPQIPRCIFNWNRSTRLAYKGMVSGSYTPARNGSLCRCLYTPKLWVSQKSTSSCERICSAADSAAD